MRRLTVLIAKELRDQRLLLVLAFASAPMVGHGLQRGMLALGLADTSGVPLVLDLLLLLFAALFAADLGAQDEGSGVSATIGRLPVSPSWAWGAKALALVLACVVLHAWLLVGDAAVRAALGHSLAPLAYQVDGAAYVQAAALSLGFLVLSLAFLLGRGLPAAALGILSSGALVFVIAGAEESHEGRFLESLILPWPALALTGFAVATLALVSRATYSPWRALRGVALRRAAFGAATLALCLGPACGASYLRLLRWLDLAPGDAGLAVIGLSAAPDGTTLALAMARWDDKGTGLPGSFEVWMLDVESGDVREVGEGPRAFVDMHGHAADGLLRLYSMNVWSQRRAEGMEVWTPDGRELLEFVPESRLNDEEYLGLQRGGGWRSFGRRTKLADGSTRYDLRWVDRDLDFSVTSFETPIALREPGTLLLVDGARDLVRYEAATSTSRRLAALGERDHVDRTGSLDGGRTAIRNPLEGARILDARTGARLAGPWPGTFQVTWSTRDPQLAWAIDHRERPTLHVLDGALERAVDLETRGHWPTCSTILADGRVVVATRGEYRWVDGRVTFTGEEGRVLLLDADGRYLRTLYGARVSSP